MSSFEPRPGITLLSMALLVLVASCGPTSTPTPRPGQGLAESYWQEGCQLVRRGHDAQAVRKFEQAIIVRPGFVTCLCDLARACLGLGRLDDAISHFEKALVYDKSCYAARIGLCEAYHAKRNDDRCIAEADLAVKAWPGRDLPYYWRGLAHRRKGNGQQAEDDFKLAIERNRRCDRAHLALGELYSRIGVLDKAATHLEAAIGANANCVTAYLVLARMRIEQGDHDAAQVLLDRLIRRDRGAKAPITMMGHLHLARGARARAAGDEVRFRSEVQAAMDRFKSVLRLDESDGNAKIGLEEARRLLATEK